MDLQAQKYNQAAIGYLVYGVIYLAGAIYLGRIGKGPDGTVWWSLIGAAMAGPARRAAERLILTPPDCRTATKREAHD